MHLLFVDCEIEAGSVSIFVCSHYKSLFFIFKHFMLHARCMNIIVMLLFYLAFMLSQIYATDIALFSLSVIEGTDSFSHFLVLSNI